MRTLNRSHPLAQGMAFWHLTQPDAIGGLSCRDLVKGRQGTLGGWSGAAPYVVNQATGTGALSYSSGRYVDLGSRPLLEAGTEWSVGAWGYITDQTSDAAIITQRQTANVGSNPFAVYSKNGQLAISHDNNFSRFGPTFTTNAWWYLAMTFSATTITAHMLSRAGAYSTGTFPSDARVKTGSGITAYLGAMHNQAIAYWPGYLDCISLHSRALSANEVREMWSESIRGFPTLLSPTRPRSPLYADAGTPPASDAPPWLLNHDLSGGLLTMGM